MTLLEATDGVAILC